MKNNPVEQLISRRLYDMPNDDDDLVFLLDELIEEKNFELALKTLRDVSDSFSRYDEYLAKIGLLIK
jgi:uncharacterized sporulation protein YeaH/YhbH (DUF444 family)